MHFQLKKTIVHVTVLTALLPIAAFAADTSKALRDPDLAPKRGEYAYDTFGRVVRTTVVGDCVYTTYWTPETATPECNPNLFGKASAPAAPAPQAAQAPAPQPAPQPTQQTQTTAVETVEYEAMQYAEPSPPAPEPAAAPDLVPVPPASEETSQDDQIGEPKTFEEEAAAAEEEVIAIPEYHNEEAAAAEEEAIAIPEYHNEEEGGQNDEGIVGQSQYYEEEESAPDDGIVGQSQYHEEEEGVQNDEGIVGQSQYYEEEEGVQNDEGIVGQSQYDEEEESAPDDGIVARSEYYEEEEGKQPEDLISEPKATEESAVAAAEQEQPAAPAVAAAEQEQPAAPAVAAAEQEQAAAPAEAAPAAAPQPTPVMLPLTITLEAEPWFDFDRYTVRSDSRDKLDKLASDMSGVEYDQIVVVGHADPIGTPEYNQVLSERRARAVKNYLVGKGVAADRIRTEGRGEFDLPFDPALCKGQKGKRYISCLQPDRSVEVTVTGTKPQQ